MFSHIDEGRVYFYSIKPEAIKSILEETIEDIKIDEIRSITTHYDKNKLYEVEVLTEGKIIGVSINIDLEKLKEEC